LEPVFGTSFWNQFLEPVFGTSFWNQFLEPVFGKFGLKIGVKKLGVKNVCPKRKIFRI